MKRSTHLSRAFLLLIAMTQAGCVDCDQPLVDPDKAEVDERLFGQWRSAEPKDFKVHYLVGRVWKNRIERAPKGLMVGYSFETGPNHEIDLGKIPGFLLTTKIGSDCYLIEIIRKELGVPKEWKAEDVKTYTPCKYEIKDDRLTVWAMDAAATGDLIEGGKLKGRIKKGFIRNVRLSESTENLRVFLKTDAGKALFNDKNKTVLERVKW